MMVGQIAHLNFGAYILWSIVPVIFALGCSYGIIWLMSHKNIRGAKSAAKKQEPEDQPLNLPHMIKGLVLLVVVIALFFSPLPKELIALAAAGIHLAQPEISAPTYLLGLVDWPVLILFMGLFVVTGAFQSTGYGDQAVQWFAQGGFDLNAPHTLIVVTAVLSNLINNSAAVMLLLKVISLSHPVTAYILALANSFGGSLLVIGSVSNIIVVQQAQQMGISIGFRDFVRLSIPVTLVALGGLFLWVIC